MATSLHPWNHRAPLQKPNMKLLSSVYFVVLCFGVFANAAIILPGSEGGVGAPPGGDISHTHPVPPTHTLPTPPSITPPTPPSITHPTPPSITHPTPPSITHPSRTVTFTLPTFPPTTTTRSRFRPDHSTRHPAPTHSDRDTTTTTGFNFVTPVAPLFRREG